MSTFLDNWLLRRAMSAPRGGGGYTADSYIQNGLIFQLDAIDKRGNGTTWVDRIGGIVFDNHGAVFGTDYVEFDGSSYLQNLTASPIGDYTSGATIEFAFTLPPHSSPQLMFIQNYSGEYPSGGYYSNAAFMYTVGQYKYVPVLIGTEKLLSFTGNYAGVADGEICSFSPTFKDNWSIRSGNGICIGCRAPNQNNLIGKIHSIRIYNRELSQAEMLANQRVDNTRFNLGLSI